jgi:hypothetical protein
VSGAALQDLEAAQDKQRDKNYTSYQPAPAGKSLKGHTYSFKLNSGLLPNYFQANLMVHSFESPNPPEGDR